MYNLIFISLFFIFTNGCENRDGNCYSELNTTYIISPLSYNLNLLIETYKIQNQIPNAISYQSLLTLHVSYNYLCNYTIDEIDKIGNILTKSIKFFKPFSLIVKSIDCNIDLKLGDRKYLHFIFKNTKQLKFYSKMIENLLKKNGMKIKNPHSKSGPKFHITIATLPLDYNITNLLNKYQNYTFANINVYSLVLTKPYRIWV